MGVGYRAEHSGLQHNEDQFEHEPFQVEYRGASSDQAFHPSWQVFAGRLGGLERQRWMLFFLNRGGGGEEKDPSAIRHYHRSTYHSHSQSHRCGLDSTAELLQLTC